MNMNEELLIKIGKENIRLNNYGFEEFEIGDVVKCHFADEKIKKDWVGLVIGKLKDGYYGLQFSEEEGDSGTAHGNEMKKYNEFKIK